MTNAVTQSDINAAIKLAEHALRNLSPKAERDVDMNDLVKHANAIRVAAETPLLSKIETLIAALASARDVLRHAAYRTTGMENMVNAIDSLILEIQPS